jgi:hypothetical protein
MYPYIGPPPPFIPYGFDPDCPFAPQSPEAWMKEELDRYKHYLELCVSYDREQRGLTADGEMRGINLWRKPRPKSTSTSARKTPVNHNKRTKDLLKSQGWEPTLVEHFNTHSMRKSDFLGVFDFVGTHPTRGTAGFQVTSYPNMSSRRAKMLASKQLVRWVRDGNRAYLIGWKRIQNADGKILRYDPVIEPIHKMVAI